MSCEIGTLSTTYLGLPLVGNVHMGYRFAPWKKCYLAKGTKFTL